MIKRKILVLSLSWFLFILLSLLWNYHSAKKEQERTALLTSRGIFNYILSTRLWNARHGSVYVPTTESTQPNRYLNVPMREIYVNDAMTLTQVNPSFMTRQISEIAMKQYGIYYHMTSLKPIRPKNNPTDREKIILQEFENGAVEKGVFLKGDNRKYFFYMSSLRAEEECLKCHNKQGYNVGDVIGGISIELPIITQLPVYPLILGHSALAVLGFWGIVITVRRLNEAYDKIKNQAVTDALTGIPNRRFFSETILKEFNRSRRDLQPMSLIMCDIDNFKMYNDTYGHGQGDSCLQEVARGIDDSLKRPGDFCARYGGEEFIVILPNTTSNGARTIGERIRSNIEKMNIDHENSLPAKIVTISLGVVTSDSTATLSHDELIKNADKALYDAKKHGKNMVCCFQDIGTHNHE